MSKTSRSTVNQPKQWRPTADSWAALKGALAVFSARGASQEDLICATHLWMASLSPAELRAKLSPFLDAVEKERESRAEEPLLPDPVVVAPQRTYLAGRQEPKKRRKRA